MKNKEKYAKEIMEIACSGDRIAITKGSGRIVPCCSLLCSECLFRANDCRKNIKDWAESEYIEKPVVSKRDKTFLEYIKEEYKYIARDENGKLFAYKSKSCKLERFSSWVDSGCGGLYLKYNVDFPMVKWEDSEPWLIEDLKKLEVVDDYE